VAALSRTSRSSQSRIWDQGCCKSSPAVALGTPWRRGGSGGRRGDEVRQRSPAHRARHQSQDGIWAGALHLRRLLLDPLGAEGSRVGGAGMKCASPDPTLRACQGSEIPLLAAALHLRWIHLDPLGAEAPRLGGPEMKCGSCTTRYLQSKQRCELHAATENSRNCTIFS
jgi:hypothetical protein